MRSSREVEPYPGAPPPVRVPPEDGRGRTSRRIRTRNQADRRSLQRLQRQGSQVYEAEETVDFPPVPSHERKCTDVAFLLIFCFYWIGMIVVAVVAYEAGNPARLIYGSDYQGNVCGDEKGTQGGNPFVVFPRAEQDIDQSELYVATSTLLGFDFDFFDVDFFSVCASSCPKTGDFVCTYEAEEDIAAALIPRSETREQIIRGCLNNPLLNVFGLGSACQSRLIQQGCWEQFFDNTAILFRCFPEFEYTVELLADESECLIARNYTIGSSIRSVCVKFKEVSRVTKIEPLDSNPLFDTFNSVNRVFQDLYGDVLKAQNVILFCGLGIALLTGLLYVGSLWCCVGLVVWLSILMCIGLLIAFAVFCYFKAGILNEDVISSVANTVDSFIAGATTILNLPGSAPGVIPANNTVVDSGTELPLLLGVSLEYREEFEIAAYITTVITSLLLLLVLGLFSRINKAIQIFAEASRCVRNNLTLLVVPPIGVGFLVTTILFWVITAAHVTTMGTISNFTLPFGLSDNLNLTEFDFNNKVFGPFDFVTVFNVFILFGALWSMSFTSGVAHMTMAHVVAKWYWSGSPDDYRTAGRWALCSSVKTVFRNHLGSAAFGSLLISLIQLVRYIAAFIQHRFNKVKSKNRVLRYLFMSLNCCLKCAETCVKFISKHAYVMTAMYGTSFCTSTKMVFSAISHNLAQVGTVTFLGDIILRFGQILVTVVAGFSAWVYMDGAPEFNIGGNLQLSSFIFPVFITMVLAWFVAYEIFNVYDVAVDTILISYCQDRKLVKIRASTHRPQYEKNKNLTDFIERNRTGRPIVEQNSLSVLA